MNLLKGLLLIGLVFVLSSCVQPPVKLDADEKNSVYVAFENQQEKLKYWQMHGRFSFRVDNQIHTGNIHWINNGDSYGIKFTGPFDQGSVIIAGDRHGVSLKDSQGYEGSATTPEAMLTRYTQYEMPISRLRYWVLGLPTPYSIPQVKLNPQGYPMEMQEEDWRIEYQYFREVGDYLLPNKIIIHHPTMKITLSIYDWKVSDKPYQ